MLEPELCGEIAHFVLLPVNALRLPEHPFSKRQRVKYCREKQYRLLVGVPVLETSPLGNVVLLCVRESGIPVPGQLDGRLDMSGAFFSFACVRMASIIYQGSSA